MNLQLACTDDYQSLKSFVNENLKLVGEWDQPGSDKKVFTDGSVSISWRKNRKDLQFSGKDATKLKRMVCSMICTENVNTTKYTDNSSIVCTDGLTGPNCQCRCDELLTDVEGIKLDQVINERIIISNTSSINKVEKLLMKFEEQNEELRRQINSLKEKVNDPLHESVFEYANIKQSRHTNNVINPSSKVINNTSKLEMLIPAKDSDETARSEVDHTCLTTRVSSSEPKPKLDDSQVEIIMPMMNNTRPTSGVDTLTADPVSCSITNSNIVSPAPFRELNLPLIEFPNLNNNTESKDHLNTLQTPFLQGTLSHPTRHQTAPQVRIKYTVNERHRRTKTSANEWHIYVRYVYQTIGC